MILKGNTSLINTYQSCHHVSSYLGLLVCLFQQGTSLRATDVEHTSICMAAGDAGVKPGSVQCCVLLCPSNSARHGTSWHPGSLCSWTAQIQTLADCLSGCSSQTVFRVPFLRMCLVRLAFLGDHKKRTERVWYPILFYSKPTFCIPRASCGLIHAMPVHQAPRQARPENAQSRMRRNNNSMTAEIIRWIVVSDL